MKSKTLRRARVTLARTHNHGEADFWSDAARYWRTTPREGPWTEEICHRNEMASRAWQSYHAKRAAGHWLPIPSPFPHIP